MYMRKGDPVGILRGKSVKNRTEKERRFSLRTTHLRAAPGKVKLARRELSTFTRAWAPLRRGFFPAQFRAAHRAKAQPKF